MIEPRMSNWNIEARTSIIKNFYVCYRSADWEYPNVIACYDTEEFESKNDAVLRCRELNAQLVDGWLSDGHPQNW